MTSLRCLRSSLLGIGVLFVAVGCGPKYAPVSGTVTMNDKPLVNAVVTFFPDSKEADPGPGSQGKTDDKGHFSLRLMSGNAAGAVVGKHRVEITAYEGDAEEDSSSLAKRPFRKAIIPAEYNVNSTLTFEVASGGTDRADFPLKSRPK
jgi:hypothetical protein